MPFLTIEKFTPHYRTRIIKKLVLSLIVLVVPFIILAAWAVYDLITNSGYFLAQAALGINKQINYQGKLANSAGTAMTDGNYGFKFELFDEISGGTKLWEETWTATSTAGAITLRDGVFSAPLGTSTTLTTSIFANDNLYLQVYLDADSNGSFEENFSPRKRITAAPYAFNSDTIDSYHASLTASSSTIPVLDTNGGFTFGSVTTTNSLKVTGSATLATTTFSFYGDLINTNVTENITPSGNLAGSHFPLWTSNAYLVLSGVPLGQAQIGTAFNKGISVIESLYNDPILGLVMPNITFNSNNLSLSASIEFNTTTLEMSFKDATGYSFDNGITTTDNLYASGFASSTVGLFTQGNVRGQKLLVNTSTPWDIYELAVNGDAVVAGNFYNLGSATTTGTLNVNGYASTTNLALSPNGINLANLNDVYVSGGNLFFDAIQLTGDNGLSFWEYVWDKTIAPTSTNTGFYVTASSTVAANFRVDGSVTTTDSFYIGGYASSTAGLFTQGNVRGQKLLVNTSTPWDIYELAVNGDAVITGNLYGLGYGQFNNVSTTDSIYAGGYASSTAGLFTQGNVRGQKLLVNTSTPWDIYELAVNGDAVITGNLYGLGYGQFNNVSTTDMLYAGRRLGVNTTTPRYIFGAQNTIVMNSNDNAVSEVTLNLNGDVKGTDSPVNPQNYGSVVNLNLRGNISNGAWPQTYASIINVTSSATINATSTDALQYLYGQKIIISNGSNIRETFGSIGWKYNYGLYSSVINFGSQILDGSVVSEARSYGVYGEAVDNSTSTGLTYGVYGTSADYGVYGESIGTAGVSGIGVFGSGTLYGIKASERLGAIAALYVDGTMILAGNATTTGWLKVGTSTGIGTLSMQGGDLFVTRNATTTGNVYLGSNDTNFVFLDDGQADNADADASSTALVFDGQNSFGGGADSKHYLREKSISGSVVSWLSFDTVNGLGTYRDVFNVMYNGVGIGLDNAGNDDYLYFDSWSSRGIDGTSYLAWNNASSRFDFSNDLNVAGSVTSTGQLYVGEKIGIVTTTPASVLVVNASNATTDLLQVATTTHQNIFKINRAGRIMIGTSSPYTFPNSYASMVTVQPRIEDGVGANIALLQSAATTLGGASAGVTLAENPLNNAWSLSKMTSGNDAAIANNFSISYRYNPTAALYDILNLTTGQKVGINTTTPAAVLQVHDFSDPAPTNILFAVTTSTNAAAAPNTKFKILASGDYYADGALKSGHADYAEYFWTKNIDLIAGEAVCVDVTKNNAVERCARGADPNIMGIISTHPAVIGNAPDDEERGVNYVIVGLLGQIPAKASAENGEIRPGDSLTSASSTSGYVMRADAGDSTVGVALEGLSDGHGTINVLISRRNKSLSVEQVEEKITQHIAEMEIEDEVNILVADAVANLNLDETINGVLDPKLLLLNTRLTVEVDSLNTKFNAINLTINELQTAATEADLRLDNLDSKAAVLTEFASSTTQILAGLTSQLGDLSNLMAVTKDIISEQQINLEQTSSSLALLWGEVNALKALLTGNANLTTTVSTSQTDWQVANLTVNQAAEFYGTIIVYGEAAFESKATFKKHVYFDEDAAGIATIPTSATSTEVKFKEVYEAVPVVNITPKSDMRGIGYWVTEEATTGFRIVINSTTSEELKFNWQAVATVNNFGQVAGAQEQIIFGCLDPGATNYNPQATQSDGSCVYPETNVPPASVAPPAIATSTTDLESPASTSSSIIISAPSEEFIIIPEGNLLLSESDSTPEDFSAIP